MGGLSRKNGRNGQNGGCGVDGMMWNMVESSQQQDRFKRNVRKKSEAKPRSDEQKLHTAQNRGELFVRTPLSAP